MLYKMQSDDPNGDATEHRIHDGDYYTFADEAPRYVTVDIPSVEPKCHDRGEHVMTDGEDDFGGMAT